MKKLLFFLMLLGLTASGLSQDKKWEHSVNVGMGLALDNVEIKKKVQQSRCLP